MVEILWQWQAGPEETRINETYDLCLHLTAYQGQVMATGQAMCTSDASKLHKDHRYVKVKSGKIVALVKIFLNKATLTILLRPIFTIFSILVNHDIIHVT